jgi:hypothetical protein
MIEAVGSNRVHWWRNARQGESRIVIGLPDYNYVTIVADRGEYALLWTAYCVEQSHRQQKLRREYEEYVASGDANRLTPPW